MDKKKLIEGLNNDLAGELGAIAQYITYAAKATGPYRPQLAQFFLDELKQCRVRVFLFIIHLVQIQIPFS